VDYKRARNLSECIEYMIIRVDTGKAILSQGWKKCNITKLLTALDSEALWSRIIPMQLGTKRTGYTLKCVPIDRENIENAIRSGWGAMRKKMYVRRLELH
jgi:hypothetical protein